MFGFRENISAKHILGGLAFLAVFVVSMVAMFHTDATNGGASLLETIGGVVGLGGLLFCFFDYYPLVEEDDYEEEDDDEEIEMTPSEKMFSRARSVLFFAAAITLFICMLALAFIDLSEQVTKILVICCFVSCAVGLVISKFESDYYLDNYEYYDDDDSNSNDE